MMLEAMVEGEAIEPSAVASQMEPPSGPSVREK